MKKIIVKIIVFGLVCTAFYKESTARDSEPNTISDVKIKEGTVPKIIEKAAPKKSLNPSIKANRIHKPMMKIPSPSIRHEVGGDSTMKIPSPLILPDVGDYSKPWSEEVGGDSKPWSEKP